MNDNNNNWSGQNPNYPNQQQAYPQQQTYPQQAYPQQPHPQAHPQQPQQQAYPQQAYQQPQQAYQQQPQQQAYQQPQQPQWQPPGQQAQQSSVGGQSFGLPSMLSGGGKKKVYLGIAGAVALAIASVVGIVIKNKVRGAKTAKGAVSLSSVGIDKKSAQVDEMIGAMEGHARTKWRKDATWWSVNVHGVRPDGTVDLTSNGGTATLTYVSKAGVTATTKKKREDSLKEYSMNGNGAKSNTIISAKKAWTGFEPLPAPGCTVGDVVAVLNTRGFESGTVRVSFDPKFGFASGWNWKVWSNDDALQGYYSMDDCAYSKKAPK